MLKNYLKIALRNLRRHKGHAFINVLGLAIGIACCVLIGLYVQDELSYDDFHEKASRIYRLASDVKMPQRTGNFAPTSAPMGPALEQDWANVTESVRFGMVPSKMLLEHGGQQFYEDNAFYADPTVFGVFDFALARGNAETALDKPNSVVLTKSAAGKYFGGKDPIGQTLRVNGEWTATVTGVLAEIPSSSHLQFDLLFSFATFEAQRPSATQNWLRNTVYTYLLLAPGSDQSQLKAQLPKFLDRHVGDQLQETKIDVSLALQPLTDIYLHSDRLREAGPTGNPTRIYVFSAIAIFVLLIACVNFMNLTTARSTRRATEVGMRKAVGAHRSQLAGQFLSEAVLISLMALLTGLVLARVALPAFNALAGKSLSLSALYGGPYLLALIGLAVGVGLLAGSYPALVLSRFEPAAVLRGLSGSAAGGSGKLRKGLVIGQFAISIALIVGTLVVYNQLQHMKNQELGFKEEHMLTINFEGASQVIQQREAVRREFAEIPSVKSATFSSNTPGEKVLINTYTKFAVGGGQTSEMAMNVFSVDYNFTDTYGLDLAAGRDFTSRRATDSTSAFLINEAAVQKLGFERAKQALGKSVSHSPEMAGGGQVVGVVEDFNYASLRQEIEPLLFQVDPGTFRSVSLRLKTGNISATLSDLRQAWQRLVPGRPFEYAFLDQRFDRLYQAQERFGQVFSIFAGLAILIACLGLFGLAAFTAERRTKEIGIRKALGASVPSIVGLLSKDFLKLVGIAFVVAVPAAYYAMHQWLEGFAYRISLGAGVFLLAGLIAVLVALATISYHAVRAARTDPVNALRYE
jgi:putative ABC transport system permease protein